MKFYFYVSDGSINMHSHLAVPTTSYGKKTIWLNYTFFVHVTHVFYNPAFPVDS